MKYLSLKCLSMKWLSKKCMVLWNVPTYEIFYPLNFLSMICPSCKMFNLWNFLSMKFPKYQISHLWNFISMKYPKCDISYLWNVLSRKLLFPEMSLSLKFGFSEISEIWFLWNIRNLVSLKYPPWIVFPWNVPTAKPKRELDDYI